MTKADLRENYPFGMFAVPREQVSRIHASSGTTGRPTVVGYTRDDLDTWAQVVARSIAAAGGRPGDMVHIAYGYGLFTGGLGAHYGAERLGCTVVPVSGGMTSAGAAHHGLPARIIMVTPSYFLAILDEMEAQGVDPAPPRSRSGFRGRAVDGADARGGRAPQRHPRGRHLRPSEVMGPGVSQESGRPRTACTSGRTTSTPRSSTRSRARCCPTARRASCFTAHQAGDAPWCATAPAT